MTNEDRIYGLIAQAENIQAHAIGLQKEASEAFSELPRSVERAASKIRSTALLGALYVIASGVVVSVVAVAGLWWGTQHLRGRLVDLQREVATLEATAEQLTSKTWRLELVNYGDGTRGILLPKGVKVDRTGNVPDGRAAVVIKP